MDGLVDKYGNDQHWCDCQHATDDKGNRYVGKYCEHPAVNYCDSGNSGMSSKVAFCVEGECNADDTGPMCLCNKGYVGEHCQYVKGSVPTCALDCQNGGHCVLGELPLTNTSLSGVYHFGDAQLENRDDMQHCLCRDGYDGEFCEYQQQLQQPDLAKENGMCGEGACQWGAQCIEKSDMDGNLHYHCDCSTAEKDVAGKFCEYEKTTPCGTSDVDGQNRFCTNQGTCKDHIYEGCDCSAGFTGYACQFQTHEVLRTASSSKDGTSICTREDDWGPSRPLSFCLHGGQCKAVISANETHPGCSCEATWGGPHCEIHIGSMEDETSTLFAPTVSSTKTNSEVKNASTNLKDSGLIILEVILLFLAIVLVIAIFASGASRCLRRQKRQQDSAESAQFQIGEGGRYQDEPNLSPHRDSGWIDPIPKRCFQSSSSDPFAAMAAQTPYSGPRTDSTCKSFPSPQRIPTPALSAEDSGGSMLTPVEIC